MGLALVLVMPLPRDRSHRTAGNTEPASAFTVIDAIAPWIVASPRCRGDGNVRDNAAAAMGNPSFGYQAIIEAEGAETGDISRVTLRPGRGHPRRGLFYRTPHAGEERGDRLGSHKSQ